MQCQTRRAGGPVGCGGMVGQRIERVPRLSAIGALEKRCGLGPGIKRIDRQMQRPDRMEPVREGRIAHGLEPEHLACAFVGLEPAVYLTGGQLGEPPVLSPIARAEDARAKKVVAPTGPDRAGLRAAGHVIYRPAFAMRAGDLPVRARVLGQNECAFGGADKKMGHAARPLVQDHPSISRRARAQA